MSRDFTTIVMTYNIWGGFLWPEREPAFRAFFSCRAPDLLAVQELVPQTRSVLDEVLPDHTRVHDDFPGWATGSNIWWQQDRYRLEEYGAEDLGVDRDSRRLFWVQLTPLESPQTPIVLATAHYIWPGHPDEESTSHNPRIAQAKRTVELLDRIAGAGACLFVGDLNDDHHPVRLLRRAGFQDSFTALGTVSPPTSPVFPVPRPEGDDPPKDIPKVIDYQFHRGPIRPRCSEVAEFFHDRIAPSDHKPVITAYTLTDTS